MPSDQDDGLPLAAAAARLGITENAARKRAQRGSLPAAKDGAGLWRIFFPDDDQATPAADGQATGQAAGQATARPPDPLLTALTEEVTWLRSQLAVKDQTITHLAARVADIADRLPALSSGPQDAPTTLPGAPGRARVPSSLYGVAAAVMIATLFTTWLVIEDDYDQAASVAAVLALPISLLLTLVAIVMSGRR